MFDLKAVQSALAAQSLDGWLLYDFRGSNPLAARVAGTAEAHRSRRWFYFVPREGDPRKLVHRIEAGALDHLPGAAKTVYLRWQELEAGVAELVEGAKVVAMEYSPGGGNPYISRVDAGTVELVQSLGVNVVSSGDLIQSFESTWSDEQWAMHQEVSGHTDAAFGVAWATIAADIRDKGFATECGVQAKILKHFADNGLVTYSPPIVAVDAHAGDPHYSPTPETDARIVPGSLVLVDLWAKVDSPQAVYSDLSRMGYVGDEVPEKYAAPFRAVCAARDAAIDAVTRAFAAGKPVQGWEVDAAARGVLEQAGYGEAFVHRTGHNIGREVHGNGCHMDSLETREERRVMPRTCFSVEPGVYFPEFGMRSEVDVYVDSSGGVHVTGGALQHEIRRIAV